MFRILAIGCCLAALTAATEPTVSGAEDWAAQMFDATKHDFGKVARGGKAEFHFVFRNPYVEDVHVASVRSSCGCTTPRASQNTLKTYEEASIVAHFNTDTFLGQRSATLTVTFDKPFYAEVQLQVQGYIRSDIILSPASVDFGNTDVGQSVERVLDLSYAGRPDWKVTGVKSGSQFIEGDVVETGRTGNQVKYQLNVRLKPGAPTGFIREQVLLQTTDSRAPELPIDVEGKVNAPLVVSPNSLFLGILQPGQKVTKQIVVQAKTPFKITGVTASDNCFEFKTGDAAKTVHLVPVTFTAGQQAGNVNYRIQIATDLGKEVATELSAYAQINPATTAQANVK
ncbi:MAG: DUF1573 domain-containing protein [Pirellulales bacterium]